jgi:hypothetical protein
MLLDTHTLPVYLVVGAAEPIELGSVDIPVTADNGQQVGGEFVVTLHAASGPLSGDVAGLLRTYADRLDDGEAGR